MLYLTAKGFGEALNDRNAVRLSPFTEHEGEARQVVNIEARQGLRWAKPAGEADNDGTRTNVFDQAVKHIAEKRAKGAKVIVSGWTEGSLDRVLQVLAEHGLANIRPVKALSDIGSLKPGEAASAVLSLEAGFETGDLVVIGEQDILGDRLVRRSSGASARGFHRRSDRPRRGQLCRTRRARHRALRRPQDDRGRRRTA